MQNNTHKGMLAWLPMPLRLGILKFSALPYQLLLTSQKKKLKARILVHSEDDLVHLGIPSEQAERVTELLNEADEAYLNAQMHATGLRLADSIAEAKVAAASIPPCTAQAQQALENADAILRENGIAT